MIVKCDVLVSCFLSHTLRGAWLFMTAWLLRGR